MKQKFLNLSLKLFAPAVVLVLPLLAKAQNANIQNGLSPLQTLFPATPYSIGGSTSLTGPNGLIYNIIFTLLTVAGATAVLFLIIGGFWYITSAGNEEQAEKGKSTLLNAIIGIVVIVLSYVIITVISNFVAGGY